MEPVRPRPFRLDPIPASRAVAYAQRKRLACFDAVVWALGTIVMAVVLTAPRLPTLDEFAEIALGMAALVFVTRSLRPLRSAAKMRKPQNAYLLSELTVEMDETGVRWSTDSVKSELKWSVVRGMARTPHHLAINIASGSFVIPVVAFAKGELERAGALARAAGVKVEELRR